MARAKDTRQQRRARQRAAAKTQDSMAREHSRNNFPAPPILPVGYEFIPRHEGGAHWVEIVHSTPTFQSRIMVRVDDVEDYLVDLQTARSEAMGGGIETPPSDSQLPSGLVIPGGPIPS